MHLYNIIIWEDLWRKKQRVAWPATSSKNSLSHCPMDDVEIILEV